VEAEAGRLRVQTVVLAGVGILFTPLDLVADFFFSLAAVDGDVGVPATTADNVRSLISAISGLSAGAIGVVAIVLTLCLPKSAGGVKAQRVVRIVAVAGLVLGVVGFGCLL
jgi:hypothetical protein